MVQNQFRKDLVQKLDSNERAGVIAYISGSNRRDVCRKLKPLKDYCNGIISGQRERNIRYKPTIGLKVGSVIIRGLNSSEIRGIPERGYVLEATADEEC